jgi:hypothetical protein
VGSIDSRLRRLEERRSGGRCPDCGLTPDERREMAVVYEEDSERSFMGDPYEACAGRGQPLYCVFNVVYDSPEVGEGVRRWGA